MLHSVQRLTTCNATPQSQKGASSRSERSGVDNLSILGVGGGVGSVEVCKVAFASRGRLWLDFAELCRLTGFDLTLDECLARVTCIGLGSAALLRSVG
jgi:hypothetical protein